jgi:hypothetical protein
MKVSSFQLAAGITKPEDAAAAAVDGAVHVACEHYQRGDGPEQIHMGRPTGADRSAFLTAYEPHPGRQAASCIEYGDIRRRDPNGGSGR